MQRKILDIDDLALDKEYIALEKNGQEIVDLYNECSLESTDLYNDILQLKFLKITEAKTLGYQDVVLLEFKNASIAELKLDNVLDDWTSFNYIKKIDDTCYEISIAEMTMTILSDIIEVSIRQASTREIEISEAKRSFKIPIDERTPKQKSLMSVSINQDRVRD